MPRPPSNARQARNTSPTKCKRKHPMLVPDPVRFGFVTYETSGSSSVAIAARLQLPVDTAAVTEDEDEETVTQRAQTGSKSNAAGR